MALYKAEEVLGEDLVVDAVAVSGGAAKLEEKSPQDGMVPYAMPCGPCRGALFKHSAGGGGKVSVYVLSDDGQTVRLTTLAHLLRCPYRSRSVLAKAKDAAK